MTRVYFSSSIRVVATEFDSNGGGKMTEIGQMRTKAYADRVAQLLDSTRGYSPECVAACIKAVEGERTWRRIAGYLPEPMDAMDAAITLLPKEANDE